MSLTKLDSSKSFISFNVKPKEDDVEVEILNIDIPDKNVLFLIGKDLKYLWDFDIKNFNYVIFENDLENINDKEFEYFWKKFFIPWTERLNDYIEIDLEKFQNQLTNIYEKKFLIKKIIHFVMMFLPYYIIKNIFEKNNIENIEDLPNVEDLLKQWEDSPGVLRKELDEEFDKVLSKSKNILNSLTSLLQYTKKGELVDSIDILEDQLNRQDAYLKLFLEFLEQTSIDNILNLIRAYVDNDFYNLIS